MVIGNCGAGKSTLSRKLGNILPLPLIHLDKEYWRPNWEEMPKAEWNIKVQALADRESWIMDGNYGGSLDIRLARADTVVFLDYPRLTCVYRVLKRIALNYGTTRADVAKGCPERFSWQFIAYVYTFRDKKRPNIIRKLENLQSGIRVVTLKNDKEADAFLNELEQNNPINSNL